MTKHPSDGAQETAEILADATTMERVRAARREVLTFASSWAREGISRRGGDGFGYPTG